MLFANSLEAPCPTFLVPTKRVFEEFEPPARVALDEVGFQSNFEHYDHLEELKRGASVIFPSSLHQRSFAFWSIEGDINGAPVDQYGTSYYVATAKGAVFDPKIVPVPYETNGFRINGLQVSSDATEALIKSQYIRSLGIPAEWIFAIDHPVLLPFPSVSRHDTDDALVDREMFMRHLPGLGKFLRDYPEKQDQVYGFVPFISYRLQKAALRPWDLSQVTDRNKEVLSRSVLADIAPTLLEHQFATQNDIETARSSRSSREKLFTEYLMKLYPTLLGNALGFFWSKGFQHNYLHGGNVTLAGEIADTESITGPFPWTKTGALFHKAVVPPKKDMRIFGELGSSFASAYFIGDTRADDIVRRVRIEVTDAMLACCETDVENDFPPSLIREMNAALR